MLRSRQKQGNALPINLVGRDALELRDDLDLERLMLGSNSGKSASFLRVGDILLERLDAGDVAAPHVLGDNPRQRVEPREDRGPIGRMWGLMRVSEDLRRRPLNRNTQILAADGIWDPDIQGYFFEDIAPRRFRVPIERFYASGVHASGLLVLEPAEFRLEDTCEVRASHFIGSASTHRPIRSHLLST